jgi:hypothetical protein
MPRPRKYAPGTPAGRPKQVMTEELPERVTKDVFADLVGLTPATIRKFQRDGIIPPSPSEGWLMFDSSLRNLFQHYAAAAKEGNHKSRPAHAVYAARAEKLSLDIAIKKGDLFNRDIFNAAIATVVGPIKTEIMSIAPRCTRDRNLRKVIDDECEALLLRLTGNVEEAARSLERNLAALEIESEDDSGRMGEDEQDLS